MIVTYLFIIEIVLRNNHIKKTDDFIDDDDDDDYDDGDDYDAFHGYVNYPDVITDVELELKKM